jgi:hypothetical protein
VKWCGEVVRGGSEDFAPKIPMECTGTTPIASDSEIGNGKMDPAKETLFPFSFGECWWGRKGLSAFPISGVTNVSECGVSLYSLVP